MILSKSSQNLKKNLLVSGKDGLISEICYLGSNFPKTRCQITPLSIEKMLRGLIWPLFLENWAKGKSFRDLATFFFSGIINSKVLSSQKRRALMQKLCLLKVTVATDELFVRFLEEFEIPKSPFEIIWPLIPMSEVPCKITMYRLLHMAKPQHFMQRFFSSLIRIK